MYNYSPDTPTNFLVAQYNETLFLEQQHDAILRTHKNKECGEVTTDPLFLLLGQAFFESCTDPHLCPLASR